MPVILLRLPVAFVRLLIRSIFLALAQIWANKIRAILTTIGIVIGVASVTAVIAALTGLKSNVLRDFESIGTNKIYIHIQWPDSGPHRHASWNVMRFRPEHFDGLLDHCPSVDRFTRIGGIGVTQARHRDKSAEANLLGIEPMWHAIENRFVVQGRPFSHIDGAEGRAVCLITAQLRDKLHLDRECVGQRIRLANRSFLIVGVVEPPAEFGVFQMGQRDDEVFVPFRTCWKLFGGYVYGLATSRSTALAEEAQAELRFFVRSKRDLKPGQLDNFRADPIQKYIEKFQALSAMVTMIAGGVVSISLLVGGVGIMNIMLVSVSERTREIGLRKAVGARASAILLQFLVEAIVLCLLGGLIGLGMGQVLTSTMAKFPQAKLQHAFIPMWAIGLSFGFSVLVGVVFGMFPAIKAARLDPIEALRHE